MSQGRGGARQYCCRAEREGIDVLKTTGVTATRKIEAGLAHNQPVTTQRTNAAYSRETCNSGLIRRYHPLLSSAGITGITTAGIAVKPVV